MREHPTAMADAPPARRWSSGVVAVHFVTLTAPHPVGDRAARCSGVGFHVGCALVMGLNRFVWAFAAAYPALLWTNLAVIRAQLRATATGRPDHRRRGRAWPAGNRRGPSALGRRWRRIAARASWHAPSSPPSRRSRPRALAAPWRGRASGRRIRAAESSHARPGRARPRRRVAQQHRDCHRTDRRRARV